MLDIQTMKNTLFLKDLTIRWLKLKEIFQFGTIFKKRSKHKVHIFWEVKISQNFVAYSEYMNFKKQTNGYFMMVL